MFTEHFQELSAHICESDDNIETCRPKSKRVGPKLKRVGADTLKGSDENTVIILD